MLTSLRAGPTFFVISKKTLITKKPGLKCKRKWRLKLTSVLQITADVKMVNPTL